MIWENIYIYLKTIYNGIINRQHQLLVLLQAVQPLMHLIKSTET